MTIVAPEQSTTAAASAKIRPGIGVTPAMKLRIKEIALAYANGEYAEESQYNSNLTAHARSLGMSYGQFVDELNETFYWMIGVGIKFTPTVVVTMVMRPRQ